MIAGRVLKKNLRLTVNGNNAIEKVNPVVLIMKHDGDLSCILWKKWNHPYLDPLGRDTS